MLDAARRASPEGEKALAGLCQVYWYPLYAYIRRQGAPQADAQDLTQQFFVHVLSTDLLAAADRQRGRFRAFLLTALKNFLANEHRRAAAVKRGGPQPPLSLDFQDGEERYTCEPAHDVTPERLFQRRALTVLDHGLACWERILRRQSATVRCPEGRLVPWETTTIHPYRNWAPL